MITVFYDGKYGLCAREIGYYRRIAPDGVFAWQDVTENLPICTRLDACSASHGCTRLNLKPWISGRYFVWGLRRIGWRV